MMEVVLNLLKGNLSALFLIFYLLTILFVVFLIILENRSPVKTVSWILVLMLLPFIGIIFYLFFGQEYRKKKMFSRKGLEDLEQLRFMTKNQLNELPQNYESFSDSVYDKRHLINLMLANSNALLTDDNEIEVLRNGDQTFPAIFSAIEHAKSHIHLEYYIVGDDTLGNQLRELLILKARQGVEVRFIFDDVGSWKLSRKYIRSLRQAGVQIDCFMKVRFPNFTSRVNYRDHRKIVIVDGQIGFIGGLNLSDRYLNGTRKLGCWRDTHLRLKGGAVTLLQVVFMADWFFVSKEVLQGKNYFKPLKHSEGKLVQIVSSGPDSDWESIGQAYFSAISTARFRVWIVTPYFIPTSEIAAAIKVAALGGIDVRILLPGHSDTIIPQWSTHSYIEEFLEAGVRIFMYQPGFIHSKIVLVDQVFASVGTANMDFRSLETNFEVNAMIYNEETTKVLEAQFENDLTNSQEIIYEDWIQRSRLDRAKESFARLLGPLL